MTLVNTSVTMGKAIDASNFYNSSMYGNYDVYDIWEYRDSTLKTTFVIFAVLVAILVVCDVILLLTCLSPVARTRSASWYLYHMAAMAVISGVIVIPTENFGKACKFTLLLSRVISCVRGINLVLVSIEIMATILTPRPSWERNRKFRFFLSFGCVWLFSIVLVSVILSVNHISYQGHHGECYIYGRFEIILLYIIKTWVPGVLILGLSIAAIVIYNKSRSNGTYDQVPDSAVSTYHRREWFICLLIVNSLYIVLDIILWEIQMAMIGDSMIELVLLIITNLVVYVMPLSMLALHEVRLALKHGMSAVIKFVRGIGRNNSRSPTDSSNNVILDMDPISDQTL